MKTAIGLMSGTSMDGIDVALLRSDGEQLIEFGPTYSIAYTPSERELLESALQDALSITTREQRPGILGEAERRVTQSHIHAVQEFLHIEELEVESIDLLGFHGQTVLHKPSEQMTVQIGDGLKLAREVGIDTVFDLRAADIEAGGQGAPLVPVFHQALAGLLNLDDPICFVNVGGISNVTYLRGHEAPIAFDTGPGNALIDQWVQSEGGIPYDSGGAIASEGRIVPTIVERYMASSYFNKPLPKSLDRLDFPPLETKCAELSDGARSLVRVSAEAIFSCLNYVSEPPRHWIICGGGRLNKTLMEDIGELALLHGGEAHSAEDVGLDGDMLEAQAFAYLAIRSVKGLPLTFPTTTGCPKPAKGGVFAACNDGKMR